MDINIWNSKSDQVQSWRTQEWCNYFTFFLFFFFFSLFCINCHISVLAQFRQKNFIQRPDARLRAVRLILWESKMADDEGASTADSPPPPLFSPFEKPPVYPAKNYSTALKHLEDLRHKTKNSPAVCVFACVCVRVRECVCVCAEVKGRKREKKKRQETTSSTVWSDFGRADC